jgi:O-antigen/teichoic acid export membrane protein
LPRTTFGAVLAAQALYGVLQIVVDSGAAFHGARLAAAQKLDAPSRASLVRIRLQLAAAAAVVTFAVGVAGGWISLQANAPFAAALVLWALFNYWEPYGRGDARPMSVYLVLRAVAPAVFACAFLGFGTTLPAYAVGVAECLSLVAVEAYFHLQPVAALRAALKAARGPWRRVAAVGVQAIAWQIGVASGTILLATSGAPAAAAALGVAVRLLTGVNQLSAVLVTSLFPALARASSISPPVSNKQSRMIDLAGRVVVFLASLALSIFLLRESFFIGLFLANGGAEAERTAALTLGVAGIAGISLLTTFVLVARHREAIAAVAFSAGTLVSIVSGLTIAAVHPSNEALCMAGALALGQTVSFLAVVLRTTSVMPELRRSLLVVGGFALMLLGGASVAAFDQSANLGVSIFSLLVGSTIFLRRRVSGPSNGEEPAATENPLGSVR